MRWAPKKDKIATDPHEAAPPSAEEEKVDEQYVAALQDVYDNTSVQAGDLTPKAKEFLAALHAAGRLAEVCAFLKVNLGQVSREHVKNWKAYFLTVLRKFDVTFYETRVTHRRKTPQVHRSKRHEVSRSLNSDAPDFVPGAMWIREFTPGKQWLVDESAAAPTPSVASLRLDGCVLNLDDADMAVGFEHGKKNSPSHAAAKNLKEEHRAMRAVHVAHKACEEEEDGELERTISVDSDGVVRSPAASPVSKGLSADKLKLYHRKKVGRSISDDQSTVASIDDSGKVHGYQPIEQTAPMIVAASSEAH